MSISMGKTLIIECKTPEYSTKILKFNVKCLFPCVKPLYSNVELLKFPVFNTIFSLFECLKNAISMP